MNRSDPHILVLVEDATLRLGLEQVISSAGYKVEPLRCVEKFLSKASLGGVGCALLELSLAGYPGLGILKRLQHSAFSLPVILLSNTSSVPLSVQALKCGAYDFLVQPLDWNLVMQAVEEAIEGSRINYELKCEAEVIQSMTATLTVRELEVFHAVTEGHLNKQIAGRLGITEKTIKVHRGRVMRKLRAGSVVDLVRIAEKLKGLCMQRQNWRREGDSNPRYDFTRITV